MSPIGAIPSRLKGRPEGVLLFCACRSDRRDEGDQKREKTAPAMLAVEALQRSRDFGYVSPPFVR